MIPKSELDKAVKITKKYVIGEAIFNWFRFI